MASETAVLLYEMHKKKNVGSFYFSEKTVKGTKFRKNASLLFDAQVSALA